MTVGNWGHEMALLRAEKERDAGIAAARNSLKLQGLLHCKSCKCEIEPERRAVLPSAIRCIECQSEFEHRKRK